MKCVVISEEECPEIVVSEKACTLCMIKKIYKYIRDKNDIPAGK
jgi:hypothetical protein